MMVVRLPQEKMAAKKRTKGSEKQMDDFLAIKLPIPKHYVEKKIMCSGWGIEKDCLGEIKHLDDAVVGADAKYLCDNCSGIYEKKEYFVKTQSKFF